jgi:hypothetical protein
MTLLFTFHFKFYFSGKVMVFNTTFNNISVILWQSVLLVEETGVPIEDHWNCEFESCSWRDLLNTTLCDKVCQWLAAGWWFSPGTPTSSTNKTDRHNITEILLSDIKHHNPNLAQVLVTIFAFLEILVITCESYCFSFTKIKKSKYLLTNHNNDTHLWLSIANKFHPTLIYC